MRRALGELVIVGLPTSQAFHLRVMDDPDFLKGELDITYLERAGQRVLAAAPRPGLERAIAVAAAIRADEMHAGPPPVSPTARQPVGPSAWVVEGRREGLREGLRD